MINHRPVGDPLVSSGRQLSTNTGDWWVTGWRLAADWLAKDRRDGLVEHLRRNYFACVAYQLRINGAWVTHMQRKCRMNGDATAYDVAYENLVIAYPRRKWRMHSVHPAYTRRSTRFYGVWWAYVQRMGCVHAEPINTPHHILVVMSANVWAVNVTFKYSFEYLNVQINLSNLISRVHHRNDIVLITGEMID